MQIWCSSVIYYTKWGTKAYSIVRQERIKPEKAAQTDSTRNRLQCKPTCLQKVRTTGFRSSRTRRGARTSWLNNLTGTKEVDWYLRWVANDGMRWDDYWAEEKWKQVCGWVGQTGCGKGGKSEDIWWMARGWHIWEVEEKNMAWR